MTDHKKEAERCVTTVTGAYNLGVLPAATVAAIGQVNATLHLAEQQYIANQIAYLAYFTGQGFGGQFIADMERSIERGLGLK